MKKKKNNPSIKFSYYDPDKDKMVEPPGKIKFQKGFISITPKSPIWDLMNAMFNSNNFNNENHI